MPFFVWDRLFYFKFVYNINEFLSPYLYCGLDIRLEYNFKQLAIGWELVGFWKLLSACKIIGWEQCKLFGQELYLAGIKKKNQRITYGRVL